MKWEIKEGVGYININTFTGNVAEATKAALVGIDKATGGKPLGYVVDLRSNPAACSTRRSTSPTTSSTAAKSSRSAAGARTISSAIMRGPATWRTACRWSC